MIIKLMFKMLKNTWKAPHPFYDIVCHIDLKLKFPIMVCVFCFYRNLTFFLSVNNYETHINLLLQSWCIIAILNYVNCLRNCSMFNEKCVNIYIVVNNKTSIVWKFVFAVTLIFIDRPFQNIIQLKIPYKIRKWNCLFFFIPVSEMCRNQFVLQQTIFQQK